MVGIISIACAGKRIQNTKSKTKIFCIGIYYSFSCKLLKRKLLEITQIDNLLNKDAMWDVIIVVSNSSNGNCQKIA